MRPFGIVLYSDVDRTIPDVFVWEFEGRKISTAPGIREPWMGNNSDIF